MRRAIRVALFAALGISALLLAGCGPKTTGSKGTLNITIAGPRAEVRSRAVVPRDLVVVITKGTLSFTQSVDLQSTGTIQAISFGEIEIGRWTINAALKDVDGYEVCAAEQTACVNTDSTTAVNLNLQWERGDLSVQVMYSATLGISSGTITATNLALQETLSTPLAISGAAGSATFSDIFPTTWQLKVDLLDKNGLSVAAGEESITVLPGRTTSASFTVSSTGTIGLVVSWDACPSAPAGFSGSFWPTDNIHPTLVWEPVAGGNGYVVYRGTSASGPKRAITDGLQKATSFTDYSAKPGQTYYYWVQAFGSSGLSSDFSGPVSLTTGGHAGYDGYIAYANAEGIRYLYTYLDSTSSYVQGSCDDVHMYGWYSTLWAEPEGGFYHLHSKIGPDATPVQLTEGNYSNRWPCWRSGKVIFSSDRDGLWHIFKLDLSNSSVVQVTSGEENEKYPSWSPDGTQIAFSSDDGLYLRSMTAPAFPVKIVGTGPGDYDPEISPDGRMIAFVSERDGNPEIYVINVDGTGLRRLTNCPAVDNQPTWAPYGVHIAFCSDRSGDTEIWGIGVAGDGLCQLTTEGGSSPSWYLELNE